MQITKLSNYIIIKSYRQINGNCGTYANVIIISINDSSTISGLRLSFYVCSTWKRRQLKLNCNFFSISKFKNIHYCDSKNTKIDFLALSHKKRIATIISFYVWNRWNRCWQRCLSGWTLVVLPLEESEDKFELACTWSW